MPSINPTISSKLLKGVTKEHISGNSWNNWLSIEVNHVWLANCNDGMDNQLNTNNTNKTTKLEHKLRSENSLSLLS